jgi:hypothetical protein
MLTESEIKAYTRDIPADIQKLKGEPPVAGAARCYAALADQWRDDAANLHLQGKEYEAKRHKGWAEHLYIKAETLNACALELHGLVRHNE